MKVIIIYNFVKYIYNMTASDHGVPSISEYAVDYFGVMCTTCGADQPISDIYIYGAISVHIN